MVEIFTTGVSVDAYAHVMKAFVDGMQKLIETMKHELGLSDIPDMANHLTELRSQFASEWYSPCLEAHYAPLRRVVGMLPLDEMAELAETLINLESLKEKVTQPTQSVGGPTDVAVITKNDGFVWIKRKHYFKPVLNPRFFARKYGS